MLNLCIQLRVRKSTVKGLLGGPFISLFPTRPSQCRVIAALQPDKSSEVGNCIHKRQASQIESNKTRRYLVSYLFRHCQKSWRHQLRGKTSL